MHNPLVPTPIVDVNGKQTTVHRRVPPVTPSPKGLSAARPALAVNGKPEKTFAVDYMMRQLPADGFLHDMGIGLEAHNQGLGIDPRGRQSGIGGGMPELTLTDVYRFMRHGATLHEAARLAHFKSIDEWEQDADFQRASSKNNTKFTDTIDLIESKNMKPAEAMKLLQNGLSDELLAASTLTVDQTLSVFSRFKYTHWTASKTAKEIPAMMDALLSGNLPYDIFESGYDKKSVTKLCSDIYGEQTKKSELSPEEREEIKSSPATITLIMELMKLHQPKESFEDPFRSTGVTYRALKEFGEEVVRENHPEKLMQVLRDGSYMGPDGVATASSFVRYCEANSGPNGVYDTPGRISIWINRTQARVSHADVVDMTRAGVPDSAIVGMLIHKQMTVDEIIEAAKNSPAALLLDGEL